MRVIVIGSATACLRGASGKQYQFLASMTGLLTFDHGHGKLLRHNLT